VGVATIAPVIFPSSSRFTDKIFSVAPTSRAFTIFIESAGSGSARTHAIGDAMHYSRSHDAVIRVYDETGNVIETHEHAGDFKEP
jgi:hypothetical protein